MKALSALLGLLVLSKSTLEAAEKIYRPSVRIAVSVSGSSGLDSSIKSYLTREFRRIDDVIVTDTNPLYRIGCVAMKNYNRGGTFTGYTLSFVVTSMMPSTMTMSIVGTGLDTEKLNALNTWNTNSGVLVNHMVQTCPPEEVVNVCKELVATFDGSLIESARQFAQSYFEATAPRPEDSDSSATRHLSGFTLTEVKAATAAKPTKTEPQPVHQDFVPVFKVTGIAGGDTLNVRSGPGMTFKSVFSLPNGTPNIEIIGSPVMNGKTEWVEIKFGEQRGWTRPKYLRSE